MRRRDFLGIVGLLAATIAGAPTPTIAKLEANPTIETFVTETGDARELAKLTELDPAYGFCIDTLANNVALVTSAVRKSQEGNVFIVDKAAYRLYIVKNGKLQKEFPIELGRDPIDSKLYEWDMRTPEGLYFINDLQEGTRTKFYKALTIDYPNKDDWARFDTAKQNGLIEPETKIGGEIQVHGSGGRGRNWTIGCVAVSNANMDVVYGAAKLGTPVCIVKYGAKYAFSRIKA